MVVKFAVDKDKVLKIELNPFRGLQETRTSPHSRTFKTSLKQKVIDAAGVLFGRVPPLVDSHKWTVGIFDYLSLFHILFLAKFLVWFAKVNDDKNASNRFKKFAKAMSIGVGIIAVPLTIARFAFAGIAMLLALPIVGIVHAIAKSKANALTEQVLEMQVRTDNSPNTTMSVRRYFAENKKSLDSALSISPVIDKKTKIVTQVKFREHFGRNDAVSDTLIAENTEINNRGICALFALNACRVTQQTEEWEHGDFKLPAVKV
jgi:hypothetical protein